MNTEILHSVIQLRKQGFSLMISATLCLCFVLFTGCDSSSLESADDIAVIEAFLFVGEPVDDIVNDYDVKYYAYFCNPHLFSH